uniref:Uncharacterized protein n=1 Tax=Romanomermis culicivorax TaxID=13658 RepID=A0A915IYG0_ROMCU
MDDQGTPSNISGVLSVVEKVINRNKF